ncbi:MAG: S24 family peptidase [Gammaproteobacteria bacterium]|nr:S24 family peptidase [Gammaproteobacteria bacterium]MCP4994265.1 S24 family peptidase [Gammaproteobacteria bacterium]
MSQDCSYNELYALQVTDDSMDPEFPLGTVIVIEPSQVCANGAFIVAFVDDERWFRQLIRDDNGERLIALKEGHPDIDLNGKEYRIEGVIVQRNIEREVKHYKPYEENNGLELD